MKSTEKLLIIELLPIHWQKVQEIYQQGINSGHATFESEVPEWDQWDKSHLPHSRWIAELENKIAGWAALSPVSSRCVYGGVAEVSVYVGEAFKAKGVGTILLKQLINSSEVNNIWTLKAGIFPENKASIHIHNKSGFRMLGIQERIGKMKDGTWRNVALLERRSTVIGID